MPNYEAMTGIANGIKEGLLAYQTMNQIKRQQGMENLLQGVRQSPQTGEYEYTPEKLAQIQYEKKQKEMQDKVNELKLQEYDPTSQYSLKSTESLRGLLGDKAAVPEGLSAVQLKELQPIIQSRLKTKEIDPLDRAYKLAQIKSLEGKTQEEKNLPQNVYAAATYSQRLEDANKQINELMGKGFDPTSISSGMQAGSLFPERFRSEPSKLMEQAKRNFINSVLRRESGSAIAPSEFESANAQYFPSAGDTPDVVAQKERNREVAIAGLKAEGAKALPRLQRGLIENVAPKKETKIINGISYEKAPGGWKKVGP